MDSLVFRRSRRQIAGFVLGAAFFVAMGYLVMIVEPSLYGRAVGWLCIAFFGAIFVSATWSLFRSGLMFTLDTTGITDHQRGVMIAWSEVEKVQIVNVRGSRFLGLVFRQPAEFLERLSPLRRLFANFNERQGWCHWNFTFTAVAPGIDEAIEFIRKNAPKVRIARN